MKKCVLFLVLPLLVLLLVACQPPAGNRAEIVSWYDLPASAKYDGSKVKITFWHRMGTQSEDIVKKWVTEFNEIYPNITVEVVKKAANYDELAEQTAISISGGMQPHIVESYPDHIARYAQADAPLNLNSFISNPNIGYTQAEIDDFLPGLWAEGSSYDLKGSIMSMPFTKSTEALYYNKTFFEKHKIDVPTTWEELFAVCERIREIDPRSNMIPFGYDSSSNFFITASEQYGASYTKYNDDGTASVTFNNATSKEMAAYFADKVHRKLMITSELNGNAYTSDNLKAGNLYMYVGSTGGARYAIPAWSDEATSFQIGVSKLPHFEGKEAAQIQQGPNLSLFKKDNQQEMIAAWLFVKYMTDTERTVEFCLPSGYAPIRYSAYETNAYKSYVASIKDVPTNSTEATNKVVYESQQLFLNYSDSFFTSPVFNLSSTARANVALLFTDIFSSEKRDAALTAHINERYQYYYSVVTR